VSHTSDYLGFLDTMKSAIKKINVNKHTGSPDNLTAA
jgi:hypothetical protein